MSETNKNNPPYNYDGLEKQTTDSGIEYYIIEEGDGNVPRPRTSIEVHYEGFLENGTKFDSSIDRGQTIRFMIGMQPTQLIKGWEEMFTKLKVGTKVVMTIPPELAYGTQPRKGIPANSTLTLHIHLIDNFAIVPFSARSLQLIKESVEGKDKYLDKVLNDNLDYMLN